MIIYIILCVLIFIFLFLLSSLFLPIDAGIEYILKDNISYVYLRIKYLNFIPLKIPLNRKARKKQAGKDVEKTEKEKLDVHNYLSLVKDIKETYNITKDEIKDIAKEIKKEVNFKDVYFDVIFDTGNAAKTGMMTGAVWTGSTLLIKILDEIFGVDKVYVNVTPYFKGKCFNMHIKSILRLKLVNIIIIVLRILKIINIFKETINKNKEKR